MIGALLQAPFFVWLGLLQYALLLGMLGTALFRLVVAPAVHRTMAR